MVAGSLPSRNIASARVVGSEMEEVNDEARYYVRSIAFDLFLIEH